MSDFHVGTQIYSGQTALDQLDDVQNQQIMLVCDPFLNDSQELQKIKNQLKIRRICLVRILLFN